ncbi:MAG TPA: hypothetical protein PLQ54_18570, partial [Armatimonadota bacterium]|nr:hypothetical protein [Armatimonadota bacterium]
PWLFDLSEWDHRRDEATQTEQPWRSDRAGGDGPDPGAEADPEQPGAEHQAEAELAPVQHRQQLAGEYSLDDDRGDPKAHEGE